MVPKRLPGHLANLNQFNPVELLVETGGSIALALEVLKVRANRLREPFLP